MLTKNQYIRQFLAYHKRFVSKWNLYSFDDSLVVSLSGGADSVALLALCKLAKTNVRAVHFNHHARESASRDQHFCETLCQKWNIPLEIVDLQFANKSNFEEQARRLRYDHFKNTRRPGELILLGHHLNDSFEWYLMNHLKSSSLSSPMGIPIARGPYRRPLMAFSRKHIEAFLGHLGQSYCHDESNRDERFERNFWRNRIITELEARYPKMLKHYVQRCLSWKNLQAVIPEKRVNRSMIVIDRPDFNQQLLLDGIIELSSQKRGGLSQELLKICRSIKEKNAGGPHLFSGGVRVWWQDGKIFVVSEKGYGRIRRMLAK